MPDPYLVGNGRWCSTCFPGGPPRTWVTRAATKRLGKTARPGCNECAGAGRIHFTAEKIVTTTVAQVRAWRARA